MNETRGDSFNPILESKAMNRAALLAPFVVALAGCWRSSWKHGLDERQANEVAAVLESAGIAAEKVAEDNNANAYKIVVGRAEAGRAFSLLEAHDLPRRSLRGLSDTFAGGTLLPSPVEDRARYAAALAVELERSLEEIPGVVSARVHLALPPRSRSSVRARTRARPRRSSSRPSTRCALADSDIKRLVAGAVHGLDVSDVGVRHRRGQRRRRRRAARSRRPAPRRPRVAHADRGAGDVGARRHPPALARPGLRVAAPRPAAPPRPRPRALVNARALTRRTRTDSSTRSAG